MQIESLLLKEQGKGNPAPSRLTTELASALRQVDRMTRLVEALLDASRMAMNGLDLAPVEVDLDALVRTVAARFDDDARASKSRIEIDAAPVRGEWDAARLEQAIAGLLANAIKYAPETVIRVAVEADEERARVTVRDTGMGIPPGALDRVFERFERAVSADSYGGFGVGGGRRRPLTGAHASDASSSSRCAQIAAELCV
jgi:signal transduction histidine kinase